MTLAGRSVVLIGLVALAGGCIPLSNGRVYTTMRVAGKLPANTLIADNSNTCDVSTETFSRVRVGDRHRCVWVPPTGAKRTVPQ